MQHQIHQTIYVLYSVRVTSPSCPYTIGITCSAPGILNRVRFEAIDEVEFLSVAED